MSSDSTERVVRADASTKREPLADVIRTLAFDAVQKANSGHPGAPMGMAEMAVALWHRHLKHDPADPSWPDRDRFVLSNGHASMLLYALLHLSGYDLPVAELQRFRQLHSKTPGHPEVGITPGVETTTGPLGQGITNAVGMALAEKLLGDTFNRPGHAIVDHHTFVFMGDGCLMEGISHEACALAGAWKLGKLVVLHDDNGISIDGPCAPWFVDDTPARMRAYGWNVIGPIDGHDVDAVDRAIAQAKAMSAVPGRSETADAPPRGAASASERGGWIPGAPTYIACRTTIGRGSPGREGTAKAHGEPLGADEITKTRAALDWTHAPFEVPAPVAQAWNARDRGAKSHASWQLRMAAYRKAHPELAAEFERRVAGRLPDNVDAIVADAVTQITAAAETMATRKASQKVLAAIAPRIPELLGGSADLTGSNLTDFPGCGAVRGGQPGGRHINYGVREFGMAAIMNGMALHGGVVPYGGTFLTFADYSRNAIRMAALMKQRVIHVFTHDSIGLGEDGPTHQPVEHAASLRLIPNLDVWRPCDGTETAVAWGESMKRADGPSALLLSRQNLPPQPRDAAQVDAVRRGGYVLADDRAARATIVATGSEVQLAMAAKALLAAQGLAVRVVSMPSTTAFDRQDDAWRTAVLGTLPRIAVEAGSTRGWGDYGCVATLGMQGFGESAPAGALFEHFGITAQRLAELVQRHAAA